MGKKHNLIYQTINTVNGKIYIGRHSTNKIDDGYLGSGIEFLEDVKKYGKESFRREILFDFDNPEDMIAKEVELLTEEYVSRDDNYNVGSGQGGLFTHRPETCERLREINIGLVSVLDANGECIKVSVNDPRYLSGELVHNTKGTVSVKDKDGKKFRVPVDDPRWLSGELIGMNTGNIRPKEAIESQKKAMREYWLKHKHSECGIKRMSEVNKGKVNVKDREGNVFRVSVNDERYLSGELVTASKGSKLSKSKKRKNNEEEKGHILISDVELEQLKLLRSEQLVQYVMADWIKNKTLISKNKT